MIPCVSGQIRDAVSVVFIPNGQPDAESPVKFWRDGGWWERSSRAGVRAGEKAWGSEGAELVLGTNGLECQAQGWGVSREW